METKSFWSTASLLADILGMSFWEALNYTVDLVQIIGTAGLHSLLGLLSGETFSSQAWEDWFMEYVPNHVEDATFLYLMTVMSAVPVDDATRKEHLTHNEAGWEAYQSAHPNDLYIEDQNSMTEDLIVYGNHPGSWNACEVIATYNALIALNGGESPVSFPDLLYNFEGAGIVAGGSFGTDPTALYLYLESSGYDTKMISGGDINSNKLSSMQDNYETFILTTYNDKNDLSEMVHTVSITCENGKYVIHNASGKTEFNSLEEAANGYKSGNGEPISVIGVRN